MNYKFKNDYSIAAHPLIIEALNKYNHEYNDAYGNDIHSLKAANKIKDIFGASNSEVHFLAGGTQTNLVFISYCLKHYEGVIAASSGHINVHETAAIEGSGHKIITINKINGKLNKEDIINVMSQYKSEHMVKPKMVYISNSTENGLIYYKDELKELYDTCLAYNLYLFIDGARLGSALTSLDNDLDKSLLGKYSDAFYVGGTKNGLLYGEALVINNPSLQKEFRYHIKNKGAMLSKGYIVGIQFEALFDNDLYFSLAKTANVMADKLRKLFLSFNMKLISSNTNQSFIVIPKDKALLILKEYDVEIWEENDKEITLRFVTSFATKDEDLDNLSIFLRTIFS